MKRSVSKENGNQKAGNLAAKLKELRLAHGYRQEDIAAAIGIQQATYSNYETGKRTPGSLALYRIASFYGMPADDLLKMSVPLDREIYYDAAAPTGAVREENDFLQYINSRDIPALSREDKELLYHFSKLTVADRKEVLDFVRFKRTQRG